MRALRLLRTRFLTIAIVLTCVIAFDARGHADQFASLPGGTALVVGISSHGPGQQVAAGNIEITGTAQIGHLGPPKDTTLIFVVDQSSSMAEDSGTDCDGDGETDSRYQCVKVAVKSAYTAATSPSSNVALVGLSTFWFCPHSYNSYARADLSPKDVTEPWPLLAPPGTDGNNNGAPDLMEDWDLNPYMDVLGNYTCFASAYWSAVDLYMQPQRDTAKTLVVMLSDGYDGGPNILPYDGNILEAVFPADIAFRAFAVPGGRCDGDADQQNYLSLDEMAAKSVDGTCQELSNWDKIGNALTAAVVPTLYDLDVTVDGEFAPIARTPQVPVAAPGTISYTAYAGLSAGSHEICAIAKGRDWGGSGSVTECITVHAKSPATVTYAGHTTQDYHDVATLSASLTGDGGVPLAGESLTFTLGGQSCSGATDAAGFASCSITLNQVPANYTVETAFGGNVQYAAAADSDAFVMTREEATLTYNGAATQDYHDIAVLSAMLTEDLAPSLPGQTVSFTLGSQSCSGVTDAAGLATCSIVVNQPSGAAAAAATFAGNAFYEPASDAKPFAITPEETTIAYTGPTLFAQGSGAVLSAVLKEDGSTEPSPAGQTITFTLGAGATMQTCSATTDANGNASCSIAAVNQPLGGGSVSASFAGDQYYETALAHAATIVYALTGSGAFVIGNGSATPGATVNWWGSQWATTNALTGGPAPSAFKGFASAIDAPLRCGTTWESSGGTSSDPPATVPAYVAVVVSSAISGPDSKIVGNATEIAIVRTIPGYKPNTGHEGYGVIVARLPCN